MNPKTKNIVKWVVNGLLTAYLLLTTLGKLAGKPGDEMFDLLTSHGLGDWILIIGIGQLISIILFIIPKTSSLGYILLMCYFSGAIVTHMAHDERFIAPVVFLIVISIANYLKNPEMLASFWK